MSLHVDKAEYTYLLNCYENVPARNKGTEAAILRPALFLPKGYVAGGKIVKTRTIMFLLEGQPPGKTPNPR
jgi:hypothetical protein